MERLTQKILQRNGIRKFGMALKKCSLPWQVDNVIVCVVETHKPGQTHIRWQVRTKRDLLFVLLFFSAVFRLILIFTGRFRIQFPTVAVTLKYFIFSPQWFIILIG